jgi:predicted metal-dependent phosphoesterase TrpH
MPADLHLHTNFSDGTYSPEELAAHAARLRLNTIALTDHDTVEGCPRAAIACRELGIEFISGAELTAEIDDTEIHLLGYYLQPDHPGLLRETAKFQQVRQNRIREMVQRLNRLGVPLRADDVFALANCRSPGRPHVGRALVRGGFCSSVDEAFERFLKKDRPAWVPKFKMSAFDGIELIHSAGGLAILAHPGLNRVDSAIRRLVDAGLDGLECFHTKHNPAQAEHYLRLARDLRLLVTGGSDCHGLAKGQPLIGSLRLDDDHVDRLREAHRTQRSIAPDTATSHSRHA